MNLVDSSAWLEYFSDGPNAAFFAAAIEKPSELVVSAINIYEVFRRVLQQRDESAALRAVAAMEQGTLVDVSEPIALHAAQLAIGHKLPMADAMILATARACGATLWTQDVDFEGIEGVRYRAKRA
ncbi:MAG TPA: type II toxin-antitoxin system VapC family toxin [Rhodanobacteraceae bacterium]|nr:type II toxin-antitoxin system VapC family toxin [Rhodanobacteraceae bacterium]